MLVLICSYLINYSLRIEVLWFGGVMLVVLPILLPVTIRRSVHQLSRVMLKLLLVKTPGHQGSGSFYQGTRGFPGPGQPELQGGRVLEDFQLVVVFARRSSLPARIFLGRTFEFLQVLLFQYDLVFSFYQMSPGTETNWNILEAATDRFSWSPLLQCANTHIKTTANWFLLRVYYYYACIATCVLGYRK